MRWLFDKFKLPAFNQVILVIILAEFVFTVGSTLIGPLFSLFIVQTIQAQVTAVGFAVAIYWIVKSILQLPIASYLDKNHGEFDDYYAMLIGLALTTSAVYLYYFVGATWHIYLLQFVIGIGDAFAVPPLLAIFTRHLDKEHEAFELALRSSFSYGGGAALGGAFSGILASIIGIRPIFIINGTMLLIGLITLTFLRPYILPRVPKQPAGFYTDKRK